MLVSPPCPSAAMPRMSLVFAGTPGGAAAAPAASAAELQAAGRPRAQRSRAPLQGAAGSGFALHTPGTLQSVHFSHARATSAQTKLK